MSKLKDVFKIFKDLKEIAKLCKKIKKLIEKSDNKYDDKLIPLLDTIIDFCS